MTIYLTEADPYTALPDLLTVLSHASKPQRNILTLTRPIPTRDLQTEMDSPPLMAPAE